MAHLQELQTPYNHITELLRQIETKFLPNDNFYLAGGAVRKAYLGEPLDGSDIDIFFSSSTNYDSVKGKLAMEANSVTSHRNGVSFIMPLGTDESKMTSALFQIISKNFHPSPEALMDDFDFTVSQYFFKAGKIYATPECIRDEKTKELKFIDNLGADHEYGHGRLFKYLKYGYQPDWRVLEKYMESADEKLSPYSVSLSSAGY